MSWRHVRPLMLVSLAVALGLFVQAAAGHPAVKADASAVTYKTGIGDQQTEMFTSTYWQRLHTKIARYVAPYDAAVRPYSLSQATAWIRAAEAQHQQILIAFYHSEYTPTKMPSIAGYQRDVRKFIKLFPKVRQYQPWNEANRGNIPKLFDSPSAVASAKYYQALKRVCSGCTIVGLDILDQDVVAPTLTYISQFKQEIRRLKTVMPSIWGLHNYSDTNRFSSSRTKAILSAVPGQVWLTETGGIVKFGRGFPNKHGSGLVRAAKALRFMFKLAGSSPRIKRLYIFQWSGGTAATRFDAGLTDSHYRPRPGYVVVCKQLHAANCNVKVSKD
jgi:hypothetical protein